MPLESKRVRTIAAFAIAALLLIAQSASAAHYHQSNYHGALTHNVQADDGLCALCLFHFQSPTNPSLAPSIDKPLLAERRAVPMTTARLVTTSIPLLFSRAPPASL